VPLDQDRHRFKVTASTDGHEWKTIIDRSDASGASPHTYVQFDQPMPVRFLKLSNIAMPGGGKVAVSDLRIFGNIDQPLPSPVEELHVTRNSDDPRHVTLNWPKVEGAKEYLIRYGIGTDKLYLSHLVRSNESTNITLYSLNHDPPYFFRVDSMNDAGVTQGAVTSGPH
jgi:xylan 1,4-beta-xylosidase